MTADVVGGVWQYAVDLADALARLGVQTTLVTFGPAPCPEQISELRKIADVHLIPTDLPLDWTAESASALNVGAKRLVQLVDKTAADILHLNSPALAASCAFPVPVVTVCHSCVATWWRAVRSGPLPDDFAWRTKLVADGYHAAAALAAPTRAFALDTAQSYSLRRTPTVVHNGRRAPVLQQSDRPSDVVFTAGRLWDEGKNLATLDRAARRLSLPVLAAGPLSGPNGALISFEHIQALGRLTDADVRKHMSMRPIFASVARYEPFGLAVLEAAQAGCALVLSDIPTFRELWDGAATFVAPDDDAALADAVDFLAVDPQQRQDLGEAARQRSAKYTVKAMAAGVMSLYATVLPRETGILSKEVAA